jgi:RNA polymerase sigma-70 factor, ECF subfamily
MGTGNRSVEQRQVSAERTSGAADAALVAPVVAATAPAKTPPPSVPPRSTAVASDGEDRGPRSTVVASDDEDRGLTFEEILSKYEKKIFNLILRYISDREEAEDLTQETFLNAYKSFGNFRGECKIQTWLCQIALNQCKNRFRQRDRRRTVEGPSLDSASSHGDEGARPLEIPDWDQSPQEVLIRNETYRYVLRAINSLPDEYRTVIILCDLQQMPYQQIAAVTGLSLEAVKTRIHRGRQMLRRKVAPYLRS